MKTISVQQAFSAAPPRSEAVVCVPGKGVTQLKTTLWFTWLNLKHQPMLSFALERDSGVELRADDALMLCFPVREEAACFEKLVTAAGSEERRLSKNASLVRREDMLVPETSVVFLRCTLANAYNYPFKKVRIFNCNLEEALCSALEE